ncbi:MAG: DUF4339 domain-containing protein [Blastochloris sp.]|nr:DUF4339 domain-containing protein [Blastochloris sp.]
MKQWFYAENGERKGPLDATSIQFLYDSGKIQPDDLVWEEGMADWVKAGTILKKTIANEAPALPSDSLSSKSIDPIFIPTNVTRPDYGDLLCWGIAIIFIPCVGSLGYIALMVFMIKELLALKKEVAAGTIQPSQFSELNPWLMGLGLFCCSPVFYPLFMHWRNETKLFKPQPHAVWFSIAVMALFIAIYLGFNVVSLLMRDGLSGLRY